MPPNSSIATSKDGAVSTRDRLLEAAAEVFARDGLAAATTREIAKAAGVNEVTLFRLFSTKMNLIAAVLERAFALPEGENCKGDVEPADPNFVREIVRQYAEDNRARLSKNFALVRVLVGEIQHFEEHERNAMRGIFRPDRQRFVERLRAGQEAGVARPELDPHIVADQIGAIVFMGLLKCSGVTQLEYTAESYHQTGIEMIVRAIELPSSAHPAASAKSPQATD